MKATRVIALAAITTATLAGCASNPTAPTINNPASNAPAGNEISKPMDVGAFLTKQGFAKDLSGKQPSFEVISPNAAYWVQPFGVVPTATTPACVYYMTEKSYPHGRDLAANPNEPFSSHQILSNSEVTLEPWLKWANDSRSINTEAGTYTLNINRVDPQEFVESLGGRDTNNFERCGNPTVS